MLFFGYLSVHTLYICMCNKTKKTNESKIFLTETDCSDSGNRLTTSYSYDGWGRNISVNYPDRTNKSISLSLDIQSGVMNGYIMTTAQSGSPAVIGTYTYADASHPHAVTSVSNPYGVMDASLRQTVSYTAFGKAAEITEELLTDDDGNALSSPQTVSSRRIIYGPDHQRWQTVLTDYDGTVTTISYLPGCDFVKRGSTTTYNCYVTADGELVAVATLTGFARNVFYAETDHLGSITGLVNTSETEVFRAEYDAWGKRDVTLSGSSIVAPGYLASGASSANYMPLRGYTGHEHYMECGLIDMNGRMYDPLTARFLSPDPYVQMPDNPQNFNRYAYCLNNPLMYTDPSGEFVWFPIIFGAMMDAYSGYQIGEAKGGDNTFWYMLGGAAIGGISGILGASASGSGFMANTISTMVGSSASSLGMSALSGGYVAPNISFGVASFDFGSKQFNTFSKNNTILQNIGYMLGTYSNLGDIGEKGSSLLLNTERHDIVSHSAILSSNEEPIISIGPSKSWFRNIESSAKKFYSNRMLGGSSATNRYAIHGENISIINANESTIRGYGKLLDKITKNGDGILPYSFLYSSCSTHTSIALNLSGIPAIGLHPYTVLASVKLWNAKITPSIINTSFYFQRKW